MTAIVETVLREYTVDEYLELEKQSEVKHEYYCGKRIPMPGESKIANQITINLTVHLTQRLRRQGYHTFDHDVKLAVKTGEIYRYPDFMIVPKSDKAHDYLVMEPVLLAEVASESSWHTDSFVKLREYLDLPTLQYYLIIRQEDMHVEFCHKENAKWHFDILTAPTDIVRLPAFDLQVSLAELYEEVPLQTP